MKLDTASPEMLVAINAEILRKLQEARIQSAPEFFEMMVYALGWNGATITESPQGKRVRPLLLLLSNKAAGGKWREAVSAAAAVEILHAFTLIHDDIEDKSVLRRGKPSLWKKYGTAMAINVGDALFAIALMATIGSEQRLGAEKANRSARVLLEASQALTQGQHLDIRFESQPDVKLADYWPMIQGKTAALLAASTQVGAIIAGADPDTEERYKQYGMNLGLAFQAQDDFLGIWGDDMQTGKSSSSDLEQGKKTLPVLYALEKRFDVDANWPQREAAHVERARIELEHLGAKHFVRETALRFNRLAIQAVEGAQPRGDAGRALISFANTLATRNF